MALAIEAAALVGNTGTAVAVAPADAHPGSVAASPPAASQGAAQAQDVPSARLMARLQHRRIEALSERTDASQTFVNVDGTLTYTAFAQPKWTKKRDSWVDLDATLQLGADGTVTPVAAEAGLVLSGGGLGALATMTVDGKKVSLTWPTPLPTPTLSGATATYADVMDGVDLQLTAAPTGGVEETLVVRTAAAGADPALSDLMQSVATSSGVTAVTDDGGNMTAKDAAGNLLVNSPAPAMWDSATTTTAVAGTHGSGVTGGNNAAAPAHVVVAKVQPGVGTKSTARRAGSRAHRAPVKASLKNHKLHLAVDKGLLSAKTTVFPVYIDPAYVPHPASGSTLHYDWVMQALPNTANYDLPPAAGLGVGFEGAYAPTGVERTYYRVSIPSAIWDGHVLSANMKVKETDSASCSSTAYGVQAWSTNVFSATTTWTNAPPKVGLQSTVNFGPACTSTPSGNFSFLDQVTNAAANHWQTIAFVLINSSETAAAQYKGFAVDPSLSVTYDTPPTTPTSLKVSPGQGLYARSGTPTFSATATDANSDTVRMDYQVLSGTTVAASGSSAYVTSGTAGTWKPGTALADGAYTWKARAYDGADYSAWTAAQTLHIDTSVPAPPAISSSDFPANTWAGTPDTDGLFSGTVTFTPAGSLCVEWSLDGAAPTNSCAATGNTPLPETVTVRAGKHTLSAYSGDFAGNVSPTATYVFYAGSGAALLTPGQGDRPARRVSLTSLGVSTDTGVTYQYRIGESDTWHTVPTADVTVTSSGAGVSSWPVSAPSGVPTALTWNITDTLVQDGPVDIRADFTDGTADAYSPANTVTVDRNAGSAPSLIAGPASVNALTGDASIDATDASEFDMTATRTASSRLPANGSAQEGQVAIFGPQWTSGTVAEAAGSDWSYLHQVSSTSVAVVDADSDQVGFTATSGGGWKAEPGAEDLTLTGSLTGSFTLKDTEGTTTTFAKVDPSATAWQATSTFLPTDNSTTQVVSEKVVVGSTVLARPKYVIAPTSAVAQSTCAATPATKGCRVLEYVYATATTASASAFGDYAGQVSQIRLWSTDPGASAATVSALASYAYDTTGRLRQEWDPRISPALKTAYDYDSAGRITTLTPPGELPWTLAYGNVGSTATAGEGMLVSASRPTLSPGSADQTNGTATTSLVYDVPLNGSSAPYAMDGSHVSAWGQSDTPSDATAVFPADAVPTSHDGAALAGGAYQRAVVTYTDPSGREVNTADPGGHITATEYDRFGNAVAELTAANRELALATGGPGLAEQQQLGIDGLPSADRAQMLSTVSVFNTDSVATDAGTDKDTDPANAGQRELEKSGPLHMVTLATTLHAGAGGTDIPAGASVPAREHTVTVYDQGRPTDGSATVANQATTVTVGAAVKGYATDGDPRTSTTGYDWAKGLTTRTVTDPAGLDLVRTTGYDSQGRVVSTALPKSDGTDAGATITTYWSATGTGACQGRPEWADQVCSVGPAGAITGGGANPAQLPTKTTTYDRYGNVTAATDTANGSTRTRSNTYDAAGRATTSSVTGGVGTAVPDTTTTYDAATGKVATVSAGGRTVTHVYDALGRLISYGDGSGNTAVTWYDDLDRPTKVTDSAPSTITYAYNTGIDPRGLETSRTDSVAGTFAATYDADGNPATQSLPGGYALTVTRNETGTPTARTYTRVSDGTEVTQDSTTDTVQGQQAVHTSDTGGQVLTYDAAGRLTHVDDTQAGITTRRTYTFDSNTNRTGLTTAVDNSDGSAGTPVTTAYTYDSADRLQTQGGTGGIVYDAFGRTTTQAGGATMGYYTDNRVRQQTSANGTNRQTWTLDAIGRSSSSTTETDNAGTWTRTKSTTNHYGDDTDNPDWSAEDADGTVTRDVQGVGGGLDATTTATGGTILQLTDLHGDITVQLPLDTSKAPIAQSYDEYGKPEGASPAARYGWLGVDERSADSLTGVLLMGFRLYDPSTGRFLQTDPVPGGSANAYDYAGGDPVNASDPSGAMIDCGNGRTGSQCNLPWNSNWKYLYRTTTVGKWQNSPENHLPQHVKAFVQTIMGIYFGGTYVSGIWFRNKYKVSVYYRYHNGRYQTKYANYSLYRQQGKVTFWFIFYGYFNVYTPWVAAW